MMDERLAVELLTSVPLAVVALYVIHRTYNLLERVNELYTEIIGAIERARTDSDHG